ncbi:Putative Transcriptional regulatory protein moc3 [Aspergillus calidoustus]|uniref:Putative Transcriptional regulatory protein moc3 n=1 Tax=Aspergillus calidoustus TaxID=454130 RepID=A0A0U5FR59_ASPCI|nr:Putative Transcriptional regulatory protein moc3 [Aspergillus calidoustus]
MARLSGRSRGCRTCRERRIKCDEKTPECSQCVRLGKKCPGAVTGLIVFEATPVNPKKFQPLKENKPPSSQAPAAAVSLGSDIVLGSGALDPFSSMAVPLDPATNVYFQHFVLHTARCCLPYSPAILGVWSWQEAMTQPAIHFGVLSMAASHRFHLLHEESGKNTSIQEIRRSLEYRHEILRITQESLAEVAPSPSKVTSIVVMIAYLLCIEGANANFEAIDAHIAGLNDFLQSIGGIDVLDLPTIAFLMGVDILCAITMGTPPGLPVSQKWAAVAMEHPVIRVSFSPIDDPESDSIPRGIFKLLGSRFSNAAWSKLLDRPLRNTIQNACRLIIHYETDELRLENEKIVNYGDNDPWMLAQRYLLSLSYDHLGPVDIREPLRRSILVLTMTRYCKFGVFPCMDTIAKNLKSSLVTRLNLFQTVAPDLFFWILYTGALAARARKRSAIYRWYCESLAEASAALRVNDWNETEPLLEQFLYVSRASDRAAEDVWRDVISLRNK